MADIIRLARTPHDEAQLLLPWYVNGTLAADEAEMVEAHLAECAECRRELEAERALCRDVAELPAGASTGPARRRLPAAAFLRRRVPLGWALAGPLAAAAAVALAIYTPSVTAPAPATYEALGAPGEASTGNVVVVFQPDQSEQALRAALLKVEAQSVGGPNSSGAYVLSVPPGERRQALDALREFPAVMLAEPIGRGDAP